MLITNNARIVSTDYDIFNFAANYKLSWAFLFLCAASYWLDLLYF